MPNIKRLDYRTFDNDDVVDGDDNEENKLTCNIPWLQSV